MLNRRLPRFSRAMLVGGAALLLVNMALSLALWGVWQTPTSWGEIPLSPVPIPETPTDVPLASSDSSLDNVVLARPVFEASRRPFVPPPPPAPPVPPPVVVEEPPQPTPDLIVDGILLNGGVRKAHLRKRNEADGDWQAEGDTLEGWTIVAVADTKVVLQRASQRIEIELYPRDESPKN